MKNNKCFFSIKLENGITITGESPIEVENYLTDIRIAVVQALDNEKNTDPNSPWIKRYQEIKDELLFALATICKNKKQQLY